MMKKVALFLILPLLFTISCNKKEDDLLDENLPPWLAEIVINIEECYSCSVTKFEYNSQFYYHYYCGYWSCWFCNLYNSQGQLVGEDFDFNDFLENSQEIGIIWQCPED